MHRNLDAPPAIAFKEGLLVGEPVQDALRAIHDHITNEVAAPLLPFL
jgi:hypothetical protein